MLSRFGPWLLLIVSVGALVGLVLTTPPSPLMRLVFLSLLFTGTFSFMFLLLRAYYSRSWSTAIQQRDPQRPVREALMMAGFVTLCAWLQILRILTLTNVLLLLGVLAFMEAFWISRTE
jgi:hypothetical protein